jgi:hypothetical protein
MAVKMPRISTQAVNGPAVIQKVRDNKTKEISWRINMRVWDSKIKDYVAIDQFHVAIGKAPAYLKAGDWNLRVSSDKTQILSGLPDSAVLVCEFAGFLHEENKAPAPTVKASSFDPSKPWIQFGIQYKVVEGDFKDLIVTEWMNYNFGSYKLEDNKLVTAYKPAAGKSTEALAQRIDALRVLEFGHIPWKGESIMWTVAGQGVDTGLINVLPVLEQRARKAVEELGAKLQVVTVGGKVAQVKPYLGDTDEIWEDDVVETGVTDSVPVDVTDAPTTEELPTDEIVWDDETTE